MLSENFSVNQDILQRLAEVLEQRKQVDAKSSYVSSLYAKGLDTILKKIGEEATETVIAAKNVVNRAAGNLRAESFWVGRNGVFMS